VSPSNALWHLLNFFAAAAVTGLLTAAMARLVWRRALQHVGWWRLVAWAIGPAVLVSIVALVLTGRDGRMGSHAAMVVACAVGIWWVGFVHRR
jgi:hypothetical protein